MRSLLTVFLFVGLLWGGCAVAPDPGSEVDPGGQVDPGGEVAPDGESDPGNEVDPGGETDPGDEVDPNGETDPDDETDPGGETDPDDETDLGTLLMFHNNAGSMCLEALDWFNSIVEDYPTLKVEEHLTTEDGEVALMYELEAEFSASQGVSTTFGYLPIMFYQDQAFSGFNDEVRDALLRLLTEGEQNPP